MASTEDIVAAAPVDMVRVQQSAKDNGCIEIVGPPPFASK